MVTAWKNLSISRKLSVALMIGLILLWGINYPIANLLAKNLVSNTPPGVQGGNDIQQVHISVGDPATAMVVMWSSSQPSTKTVFYGTDQSKLENSEGSVMYHFNSALNSKGTQYLFRAQLSSLLPHRKYYYRIGSNDNSAKTYTFVSLKDGYNWGPKCLMYGDLGEGTQSMQALIQEARMSNYTSILHVGDFAYNLNTDGGAHGDKFMNIIQPMASAVPYMTCPGDHEMPGEFIHYRSRFSMPGIDWPPKSSRVWYTYTAGLVRVISISSEVYYDESTSVNADLQQKWLTEVLAQAKRERTHRPWIVVIGHRPMYCSTQFAADDCHKNKCKLRENLESLFRDAGVDMYLAGHSHAYERMWPVHNSKPLASNYTNAKSPIHITCGTMGNYMLTDRFPGEQPPWSAKRISEREKELYCVLDVVNRTHISWSAVDARKKQVLDKVWIIAVRKFQPFTHPRNLVAGIKKHTDAITGGGGAYLSLLFVIFVLLILVTVLRRQVVLCFLSVKRKLTSGGQYRRTIDV